MPPELPMELSLAVNTSLAALSKHAIFCTEPFRIPYAGRVDVCCFDKTGTLTGEELVVEGVAGLEKDGSLKSISDVPKETTLVLATAHALVKLDDGEVVGDPMEKATMEALSWTLGKAASKSEEGLVEPIKSSSATKNTKTYIRRRFQFSSALKRQSSVAQIVEASGGVQTFASVKGAPETLRTMMAKGSLPEDYEDRYRYYTRRGSRVLALGYRWLQNEKMSKV